MREAGRSAAQQHLGDIGGENLQFVTAACLLACIYLAVTVAPQRQHDAGSGLAAGLILVTVPELLGLLRDTVIPSPRRDQAHRLHWSVWRHRHQHRARQVHQRWNAYAETAP